MHRVPKVIIVLCTSKNNENICSNSGGVQKKRKDRLKFSLPQKLIGFLTPP